jgi:hypothetical protein
MTVQFSVAWITTKSSYIVFFVFITNSSLSISLAYILWHLFFFAYTWSSSQISFGITLCGGGV